MRYMAYLKLSLKNLLAGWKASLLMVIGLPIGLSLFLGTVYSVTEDNLVTNVSIVIEDEDKTKSSEQLIGFLGSQELKEVITIEHEDDKALKLIIPKGYEQKVLSLNNIEVMYENNNDYFETKILDGILSSYHEGVYLASKNLTDIQLEELQKSSISTNLIKAEKRDYYKENSLIGITLAASILIMSLAVGFYTPSSKNLNKKTALAPMSRNTHYNLEYFSSVIYVAIMLFAYILFYNVTGLSFEGILIDSLVVIVGAALFISSAYAVIVSFFKERYGKLIANIIMMLPILFEVVLTQFLQVNLQYLSPVFVVGESFRKLLEGNVFTVELGMMYLMGIILFFIARGKVNYDWRMGK